MGFLVTAEAQESDYPEDLSIDLGFELGIRAGAGVNQPVYLGYRRDIDGTRFAGQPRMASSVHASLQAGILLEDRITLLVEGGYSNTVHRFKYDLFYGTSPMGGTSEVGDYQLDIRKTELTGSIRIRTGEKRRFYLNVGGYLYFEDSKKLTGYYSLRVQGLGYGANYQKQSLPAQNRGGVLIGIGYDVPLKNKRSLFVDLRTMYYTIMPKNEQYPFRVWENRISIGYTFYSSKTVTVNKYQGGTKPEN